MRALYVLVLLALLIPQAALAAAPQMPGYVAVIARDSGGAAQLVRLTEIQRAPRQRSESATRNWGIAVYDAGNRVLWQTHVVNPLNTTGRTVEAGAPIAGLTFANVPGAVRATLLDPDGNALLQINLGAQERSTARKNGEQLRQRMFDGNARTKTLSRSAPGNDDSVARASALKQVDYNMRQRDRLPRCNDAVPVIPEEASIRALTRSPACAGSQGLPAGDPAERLSSASQVARRLPAAPAEKLAAAANTDEATSSESVETSELDLINATLVFQGASGETATGPVLVLRFLSNGEAQWFTTDASGSVTIPVERSKQMQIAAFPTAPLLWGWFSPQPMAQDTDFTLLTQLVESVALNIKLVFPPGVDSDTAKLNVVIQNDRCCAHEWNADVFPQPPDFQSVMHVPKNESLKLLVFPEPPYLGPFNVSIGSFSEGGGLVIPIRKGVLIEGKVSSAGEPLSGAEINIKRISGDKVSQFDGAIAYANDGTYKTALDPTQDAVVVQAYQSGYARGTPVLTTLAQDRVIDFDLGSLNPVTIHAADANGDPVRFASVRIYRDGLLYSSTRTLSDGKATTALPAGSFEVRLFPDGQAGENAAFYDTQSFLLFGRPAATQILDVPANAGLETEIVANDMFRFSVSVPREFGLGCDDSRLLANVELLDETGVVARSAPRLLTNVSDGHYVLDVISGPGRYKLRVSAVGGVDYESAFFDAGAVASVALTRVGAGKLAVWEGMLRNTLGTPITYPAVIVFDASGELIPALCPLPFSPVGKFKVLECEKCTYRFFTFSIDDGLGRTVTLDDVASGSTADVFLGPPLDIDQVSLEQVKKIYGQDDAADRYDILFIAEGYTNVRETFTDINGNGVWDGVQHFDSNGNGLYDGFDRIALYGSAPYPAENTDPTINNEPFTDLNGDGVLSINDEALYQRNVRDYLSSLFSNEFYSEYRNGFRVHAALPLSNQVGVDFEGVQQRDTRFGAFAVAQRSLLNIDGGLVLEYAAEVFPDYDALVVMINQEIPMGRENSFVLATGGVLISNLNDLVGAHEFGHRIGNLGDEYSELGLEYVGPSLLRPNTTALTRDDMIPWGRYIDIENSIPTKDNFPGTGLFEGGNYYETSVYRPSMNSLMRFLSPGVFNVPSRFRMEAAISPFLHGLPGRLVLRGSAPRCGRAAKLDLSWDATEYGVSNVVIRSGSARGYVVGRGGATGSIRLAESKAGRDDLFLIDADLGTVIDIESIPRSRPLSCLPGPD